MHMTALASFGGLSVAVAAEETNTRVAVFSIVALAVCVASAGAQLWYLKKFFQRKKLL
jgi:hypothetical protein